MSTGNSVGPPLVFPELNRRQWLSWRPLHEVGSRADALRAGNSPGAQFAAGGVPVNGGEALPQDLGIASPTRGVLARREKRAALAVGRIPSAMLGVFGDRRARSGVVGCPGMRHGLCAIQPMRGFAEGTDCREARRLGMCN